MNDLADARAPRGNARIDRDALAPALDTRWLAQNFRWLESTDSTNRVAAEWARDGAPHGATVVAEGQQAGRGRLGRSFFSPAYRNLYTSIVLRGAPQPTIVFAAAIAVAQTAAETLGDREAVEIKWPNDVLLGGLKTAGILVEGQVAGGERVAILGIGVNLNIAREEFPEEFRARATSLGAARGAPIDRAGFAARLYGILETVLDRHEQGGVRCDPAPILRRFSACEAAGFESTT